MKLAPLMLVLVGLLAYAAEAATTADCMVCHGQPDLAIHQPDGTVRSLHVPSGPFEASAHGKQGCLACHGELGLSPHDPRVGQPAPLAEDVAPYVAGLPEARRRAVAKCMTCHQSQAADWRGSIHAQAAKRGSLEAPRCDNCHGAHAISAVADLESPVNPDREVSTCAKCHADSQRMATFDVNDHVVQTFEHSFHGRKRLLGDGRTAVCTSCHAPASNPHGILAPTDPGSTVNPSNVAEGCGRANCHPGVGEKFARSFSHQAPSLKVRPIVYLIGKFHYFMMSLVLSVMFGHIALDILRRRIKAARALRMGGGQA